MRLRATRTTPDCKQESVSKSVERLNLPTTNTMQGDNKDDHPKCQQLVAGVATRTAGLFVDVDVCDGYRDDSTGSQEALLSRERTLAFDILSSLRTPVTGAVQHLSPRGMFTTGSPSWKR